jgi:hypothetical protein
LKVQKLMTLLTRESGMLSLSEKVSMYLANESQMASVNLEMLGFSLCFAFTKTGHSSRNRGLHSKDICLFKVSKYSSISKGKAIRAEVIAKGKAA